MSIIAFIIWLQETQHNSSLTVKEILTFVGVLIATGWTSIAFFLNRRDTKNSKAADEDKNDTISAREENKRLLEDYKERDRVWRKDYEELSSKYEDQYNKKMAIQIELAVIAYEHELLYSKLNPEDQDMIRERVSIFKNNLNTIAVKEHEAKDNK